jgi:hypothetical protein
MPVGVCLPGAVPCVAAMTAVLRPRALYAVVAGVLFAVMQVRAPECHTMTDCAMCGPCSVDLRFHCRYS